MDKKGDSQTKTSTSKKAEKSKAETAGDAEDDDIEIVLVKTTDKYNYFDVLGTEFIVDKRYIIKEPAGSGAYGTVVIAEDTSKDQSVAIK